MFSKRKVWKADFPFLRFRPMSSHSECSICLRHKALISGLGCHLNAKLAQEALFTQHLKSQYYDRICYWEGRGVARNKGLTAVFICDGMDQCKFAAPRAPAMRAKCFSEMMRPKLHVSALIAHGRHIQIALAEADMPKDSNFCVEQIAASLEHLAADSVHLPSLHLWVQCDNTSRELKNNCTLRFLTGLVSSSALKGAKVSCLRTGHSHEDVDQLFGDLAGFIVGNLKICQTSDDFVEGIRKWLQGVHRPHERFRSVVRLDQVRDWRLGV